MLKNKFIIIFCLICLSGLPLGLSNAEDQVLEYWDVVKADFHIHTHEEPLNNTLIDKFNERGFSLLGLTDYFQLNPEWQENESIYHSYNFTWQNELKSYALDNHNMIIWNGLEVSVGTHYTMIGLDNYINLSEILEFPIENNTEENMTNLTNAVHDENGYIFEAHPTSEPYNRIVNYGLDGYEIGNSGVPLGNYYKPAYYSSYSQAYNLNVLKTGVSDGRWASILNTDTYTVVFHNSSLDFNTSTLKNSIDQKNICSYVEDDLNFFCSSAKAYQILSYWDLSSSSVVIDYNVQQIGNPNVQQVSNNSDSAIEVVLVIGIIILVAKKEFVDTT